MTFWTLSDKNGIAILKGGPYSLAKADYHSEICPKPGQYTFTISTVGEHYRQAQNTHSYKLIVGNTTLRGDNIAVESTFTVHSTVATKNIAPTLVGESIACAKEHEESNDCRLKDGKQNCCNGLVCDINYWICVKEENKFYFTFPTLLPTLLPKPNSEKKSVPSIEECAMENKWSMDCGAKSGKGKCCAGLICHKYQTLCVKEKNKECAGPNTLSAICGSLYRKAAPYCCPGLVCEGKRCVVQSIN